MVYNNIVEWNDIRKKGFIYTQNEDKKLSYFIIAYYFTQVLNQTVKNIFPIPDYLYSKISVIFGLILVFFFLNSITIVLKRSLSIFVFSELLFISLFLISFLMGNAEKSVLLYNMVWNLIICVPLGIYIYTISDLEVFYSAYSKSSFILTAILFLILLFSKQERVYNMSYSYALLVPTLFHLNQWFRDKKVLFLIVSLLEIAGIVLYGSRGPLASLLFFLFLRYLLSEKSLLKKLKVISSLFILFILYYLFFEGIGAFVLNYLTEKEYYSRNILLIFTKRITYDAGRIDIFKYYLGLIKQKPFIGWGVLGGWISKGLGPHNMIIENLLAFGIIVGGIINILLIVAQFRIFFLKNKIICDLLSIYMALCIVLFFIDGYMLTNPSLFLFLGLILNSFKSNITKIDIEKGISIKL